MIKYLPQLLLCLIIVSSINNYYKDDRRQIPDIVEPRQYNLSGYQVHSMKSIKKFGYWKVTIYPVAYFEISAKIVSIVPYFYGIDAVVSPYDFGLAWGKFMEDQDCRKLKTSSGLRTIKFKWPEKEYNKDYVVSHVANIHIIPKNNDMLKKMGKLRKGDKIYLKGYLVRVEGFNSATKEKYAKGSSLSREDTGNGAGEMMYVTDFIYHHHKPKFSQKQ